MATLAAPSEEPNRPRKAILSMAAAEALARELARQVAASGCRPDVVIGIANGGVHPAYFTADELGAPVAFYKVQRATSAIKQRLNFARRALSISFLKPILYTINGRLDRLLGGVSSVGTKLATDVRGKAVLIVDDCIDSGASVAHVREMLRSQGAREIQIAVLSWTTKYDSMALHGVTPDHCLGRSLPCYPWSADNPEYPVFTQWLDRHMRASDSIGNTKFRR